jgi:pentatricopeptide repeat protein
MSSQRSSLGLGHGYIILLGHTPNLFHYSSLLNAYSENSYYEKVEMLMKDLRSSGLTPNKVYFLCLFFFVEIL